MLRFSGRAALDAIGGMVGRPPRLVPLVGTPGTVAVVTTPDAQDADRALNPDGRYLEWQQRVAARSALRMAWYSPGRAARRVHNVTPTPALAGDLQTTSADGVNTIEVSTGTIDYLDTGTGPTIVFLHGLLMDASLWDDVIADLSVGPLRCPDPAARRPPHGDGPGCRPVAAGPRRHRQRTGPAARTERRDLVGNDTGGAIAQIILATSEGWVGRAALVSCDPFDNFPPGLTGKALFAAGRLPPVLFGLFVQQRRLRPLRRLPVAFGWVTKTGDEATVRWIKPVLARPDIRRDTVKALRALSADRSVLAEVTEQLPRFERPVLVAWAAGDRVMPPSTDAASPSCSPRGGWSRSTTATPWSRSTNHTNSPWPSET
jgi:pimeloyl-ACP methyl ester carboxylesterase